jgi:hypothetical protein
MGEIVEAFFDFLISLDNIGNIIRLNRSILFWMRCDSFCVDRTLSKQSENCFSGSKDSPALMVLFR